MKKRKAVTGCIMAVVIGICSVAGNVSAGEVTAERSPEEIKIASIHNPIVDASTEAVTFSYIYFGNYPQSEVMGEALTEEIIEADYVSDEAVVCGKKYRRLEQDNQYRYFKYTPIKWRVSEVYEGKAILRSEFILDCKPYNKDNTLEYGYSTTWVRTTIRCWLNGLEMYENEGFLQSAFSEIEQYGIADTLIREESYYSILNIEESVNDKVFLPSKWFILPNWWTKNTLIANYTDYVAASDDIENFYNQWMLRNTDSVYEGFYSYVDGNGNIHSDGLHGVSVEGEDNQASYYMNYANEVCGVCPAIQLDLSYTELWMTEEEYLASLERENVTWMKGDVNKDGAINLIDAQMVLKFSLNIEQCTKVQKICADVDADEIITLADAQGILKKALKID